MRVLSSLASLCLAFAVHSAGAQNVVINRAGSGSRVNVTPGAKFGVPITLDLSAAGGTTVNGVTLGVNYDQTKLQYDSLRGTNFYSDNTGGFGTQLRIFGGGPTQSVTTNWVTVYFTAIGSGGTSVALVPTGMTDGSNANILSRSRSQNTDVCIGPNGTWGDANGDATVNIIDAQQIARFSVALSVANPAVASAQGDVTGDGSVNIIDAQQVARFSVGLSITARVNQPLGTPVVSSLTISSVLDAIAGAMNLGVPANLAGLLAGQQAQVLPVARNAANTDVTACAAITYSSSNPAVATINAGGVITPLSAGTTTITVASGAASASTSVSVVSPYSTIAWTNPSGGSWSTPGNWSLNRVPAAGDSVVINLAGTYTINLTGASAASFVTVGGGSSAPTLAVGSQTLTVSHMLTVRSGAALTSVNGQIAGAGVMGNDGTVTITGTTINIPLDNNGTLVARATNSISALVTNNSGGTFRVQGDVGCCAGTAVVNALFINTGTIELDAIGSSTATITGGSSNILTNDGLITALGTGGQRVLNMNTVNQFGLISVTGGADMTVTKTLSNITNGRIELATGRTLTFSGGGVYAYTNGIGITGFNGGYGTVVVASGSGIVANAVTAIDATLNVSSGAITGTGLFMVPANQSYTLTSAAVTAPVQVQGTLNLRATNTFTGGVTNATGAVLRIIGDPGCCAGQATVSSAFSNAGTIELTSTNGSNAANLVMSGGNTLINQAGGTINALTGSGGTRGLTGPVSNGGTIDVSAQKLTVASTLTNAVGGVITVAANDTLQMNSAVFVSSGGTLAGAGTMFMNGGTLTVNAALSAAIANLATTNTTINGSAVLTVPSGSAFQPQSLTSVGAPIVNNGLTVIRGTTTFTAAYTGNTGSIFRIIGDPSCCAGIAVFSVSASNAGTVEMTATGGSGNTSSLQVTGTAVFTNGPSGVIQALNGTGGTRIISGSGASSLNNAGVIDVSLGTDLTIGRSLVNTGSIVVGAGQTLFLGGSGLTSTMSTGTISGAGTVNSSGGTLSLPNNFGFGTPTVQLSAVTVTGPGTLSIPATQTLTFDNLSAVGAPLANAGIMRVRASNTFSGGFTNTASSILRIEGNSGCCSGQATFSTGFTNNGTIELSSFSGASGATLTVSSGVLTNAPGAFILPLLGTGSGTRSISATMTNAGTLDVSNGVNLTYSGALTNTGTLNVGAGRIFNHASGTFTFGSGGTVSGGGQLTLSSAVAIPNGSTAQPTIASIDITGNVTGTASLNISSGVTLTTQSIPTFTPSVNVLNGGTLVARGTMTFQNPVSVASGATFRIQGDAGFALASITVPAFTNLGTIELSSVGAANSSLNIASNGTLINGLGAAINVLRTAGGVQNRTIVGSLDNRSTLSMADGVAGSLSVTGSLTMTSASALHLDLLGSPQSTDAITVSGSVTINGTATFTCSTLTNGQTFTFMTAGASMTGGLTSWTDVGYAGTINVTIPTPNVLRATAQ